MTQKEKQPISCQLVYFFLVLCMIACGCAATMQVTPSLKQVQGVDYQVSGNVQYDGRKEYLPRSIREEPSVNSPISFQYTAKESHAKDDVPELCALFNPLTLVGFPTGKDKLTITSTLTVLQKDQPVRSYTAMCIVEQTRNLFSNPNFSEMKRDGMIAVRDNIDIQLYNDRDLLTGLAAMP